MLATGATKLKAKPMKRNIHIIGVPMDLGQGRRGVDMGPSALRYAGLAERLQGLGHTVQDEGNLDVPVAEESPSAGRDGGFTGLRHLPVVQRMNRELAETCAEIVQAGGLALTLGGDHSVAAGSIAGVRSAVRTGVLWIDAHADFNSPATSPSCNLHGMPLGALLGQEPAELAPYLGDERLKPQEVVIFGLRSVDAGERALLRQRDVEIVTMRDIDELGIAAALAQVIRHFDRQGIERLHISFDPDSLDPAIAPGVGTPVPGGLTYREAHLLMETLADDGRVGSVDVVEINPILDEGNNTAALCVELLASLLGERIL